MHFSVQNSIWYMMRCDYTCRVCLKVCWGWNCLFFWGGGKTNEWVVNKVGALVREEPKGHHSSDVDQETGIIHLILN